MVLSHLAADLRAQFNIGQGEAHELYQRSCASCHGRHGEGGQGGALSDAVWKHGDTDAALTRSIAQGVPGTTMVPWKPALSDEQIRSLVIYLRELPRLAERAPAKNAGVARDAVRRGGSQSFRLRTIAEVRDDGPVPDATLWGFAVLPDRSVLTTQRSGTLWLFQPDGRREAIADTPAVWHGEGQTGLFDVVLHPEYASNGWVYLSFSERSKVEAPGGATKPRGMTVIVRGRIRDGRWRDQETVFRAADPIYTDAINHFGGRMVFRGGYLFFSVGDRVGDKLAQDLTSPCGKIHRVRGDGRVPEDNPFAFTPGACASIWSFGHRNPQGVAVHPESGALWVSEHGPRGGDEINVVRRGQNYGWPLVTLGMNYDGRPLAAVTELEGTIAPVHQWTPSIAVAGIAFYSGADFPSWRGNLLVGGMWAEELHRLTLEGERVVDDEIVLRDSGRVRHVATGSDGSLYISLTSVDLKMGTLCRVEPVELAKFEIMVPEEVGRVFDVGATDVRTLASGFRFAEGPVWTDEEGGALIFSDIPTSRTLRWSERRGIETLREPTGWGNGNAFDAAGRLLTAEHHGRRVSLRERDGSVTTLVDSFKGGSLNSPNDVVVKRDGTVWFTDPDYGILHPPASGPKPVREQKGNFVYRFDPRTRELRLVATAFDKPNGLSFSPDETRLYVTDSGAPAEVKVFDVAADGTLSGGRTFYRSGAGAPDGIKTDEAGRVYTVADDGVHIVGPDGRLLGKLLLPERPSNLCFGGRNRRTLFITTPTRLLAVEAIRAFGGSR